MARDPSLLTSTTPTAVVPASVLIGHIQLRDLIICPRERGVVNYVQHHSIVEHNLNVPDSAPRPLAKLSFIPNTLCALPIEGTDDTLLAAGGQEAEIHLSYHSPLSARHRQSAAVWHTDFRLTGSINNSVLLTSMSLTRSNESSVEPRIGISNNDCTVKFYNVPIRGQTKRSIDEVGSLRLNVPVNHSSISPDGRTLLSVGDSAKVYLHRMTGGARITFSPIATLKLPPPSSSYSPSSLTASFSTAFSSDGSKFAVASQEGLVAVWDVRSSKPMKVFQTDQSRISSGSGSGNGNGGASGWLVEEAFDWAPGSFRAPGWSVRNVKFGGEGDKEIMTFTEHTSLLHVVDARTFETEEIVQVPTVRERPPAQTSPSASASALSTPPAPPHPSQAQARPFPHYYRLSRPHSRYVPAPGTRSPPPSLPLPRHHPSPSPYQAQAHVLRALGDTFRIPSPYSPPSSISDSTWRALRMSDPSGAGSASGHNSSNGNERRNGGANGNEGEDILVIPPFGDVGIEEDVRALLGSHGIPTRTQRAQGQTHRLTGGNYDGDAFALAHDDEEDEDEQDEEDGEDRNTGSAHADYEYTSRVRGATATYPSSRRRQQQHDADDSMHIEPDEPESDCLSSRTPSRASSPPPAPAPRHSAVASYARVGAGGGGEQQVVYVEDLDIAGTCFDPRGRCVYVATTESVAEWSVRGAEKRWWAWGEWV
ncbi:putative WD40 repeats [Lyophyllum shimeji]|uniref:WD40 repeats n=1 Tax=Lyophyllum shimeji TaxID=47721 RepID=A0A9P3PQB8_LYOSH|nr:putative WD40 repeats [Lyophyllum shimeji]